MTLTHPLVDVAELNGEPWEVITAYRDFWERFPTVTDAAQAVLDGRPAVMRSEFPVEVERRLVKRFRGVVYVRTRVYLPPSADDTVMCSYLNEPDRDSAEVALRECLPLLLPESVRDRMIVVSHVSDTVMRRFAFEHLVPATMESWAEYHEQTADVLAPVLRALSMPSPEADVDLERVETVGRLLAEHDLFVTVCEACGHAVTDRHPSWEGIHVALDVSHGPVCRGFAEPVEWPHPEWRFVRGRHAPSAITA